MTHFIDALLTQHPIVSNQVDAKELRALLVELDDVLARNHDGSVVELGCYVGTTSLFIRRVLNARGGKHPFHVYDSFAGLPVKSAQDQSVAGDQFVEGELHASRKAFTMNFKKAHLEMPVVHKAWFSDLVAADMPEQITFAFLDGDYYESIRVSLELITPKLAAGAVIVVDDYMNEALPGAARATDEWLRRHNKQLRTQASLAIIRW